MINRWRNDSLTCVHTRANGVSLPGQVGDNRHMPCDLAFITDSDPGRSFPVALRNTPDQGQTQLPECIYAGQTVKRGRVSPATNRYQGHDPVTSNNASKERSS